MIRAIVCVVCVVALSGHAMADAPFGEADIRASRTVYRAPDSLPATPAAPAQCAPQFTSQGRYLFFASRDGWVTKLDLWNLVVVAEVRVGTRTHQLALSGDGKTVAVANSQPNTLVLLDADLNLLKLHTVRDKNGKIASTVAALYDAPPRRSFVAALKDVPEVWELSYDPGAEEIAVGMVHDFQYKEGAFIPGYLNPRRSYLAQPLGDFFFTRDYSEIMGAGGESGRAQLVNLDVRKKIADLPLSDLPPPRPTANRVWQVRPDACVR